MGDVEFSRIYGFISFCLQFVVYIFNDVQVLLRSNCKCPAAIYPVLYVCGLLSRKSMHISKWGPSQLFKVKFSCVYFGVRMSEFFF